ncbi:hypothetical protein HNV12_00605 [Methanococcoides sp. SA1]|nr:hypothetical protein [Methanococcoides sp. SA1]
MGYYFEIWLRGFAKDHLRKISNNDNELYHPHITLVRPFQIPGNEGKIKDKVTEFCKGKNPIFFTLEGKARFEQGINYIPVTDSIELLKFDNDLEKLLEGNVQLKQKLNDKKILHATTNTGEIIPYSPRIEQCMLRLTGIKDKKIWFSYDFVTQQTLSRQESLNKSKWYNTVHQFTQKHKLLPTRQGYKRINN